MECGDGEGKMRRPWIKPLFGLSLFQTYALIIPLIVVAVILAAIFVPLIFIWTLNTLFSLDIPYTLTMWFAALLLLILIGGLGGGAGKATTPKREQKVSALGAELSSTLPYQPSEQVVEKFCRYCGSKVPDDSEFCEKCGKRL